MLVLMLVVLVVLARFLDLRPSLVLLLELVLMLVSWRHKRRQI